jgi:hypothetical protein
VGGGEHIGGKLLRPQRVGIRGPAAPAEAARINDDIPILVGELV